MVVANTICAAAAPPGWPPSISAAKVAAKPAAASATLVTRRRPASHRSMSSWAPPTARAGSVTGRLPHPDVVGLVAAMIGIWFPFSGLAC